MATKKESITDFDDLLDEISESPAESVEVSAPVETEAEIRIRELEAKLAAATSGHAEPKPFVPSSQLTPDQLKVRELEDQLARTQAGNFDNAPEAFEEADGDTITVHILVDGFTAQGRVWYRGQTIVFQRAGSAYQQTLDRNGNSWLDIVNNPQAQIKQYGHVAFGSGPWPFSDYDDSAAAKAEAARRNAAPVLQF